MERDESLAESLLGEGRSLAKITKEKIVKTIRPIMETKTKVETTPKNLIQNLRLLKPLGCKKGWFEFVRRERLWSLDIREENFLAPVRDENFI